MTFLKCINLRVSKLNAVFLHENITEGMKLWLVLVLAVPLHPAVNKDDRWIFLVWVVVVCIMFFIWKQWFNITHQYIPLISQLWSLVPPSSTSWSVPCYFISSKCTAAFMYMYVLDINQDTEQSLPADINFTTPVIALQEHVFSLPSLYLSVIHWYRYNCKCETSAMWSQLMNETFSIFFTLTLQKHVSV
jgi:hypothetical protein